MTHPSLLEAIELLQREAVLLDLCLWDEWLDLYADDCRFWVPTWRDDSTLVSDPACEVSFLYFRGRAGLAERVRRLQQGKSITTHPLPRTCHMVSAPAWREDAGEPGGGAWHSHWTNHLHDPRTHASWSLFGLYRHRFVQQEGRWRIQDKIVTLANDRIATVMDIYSV